MTIENVHVVLYVLAFIFFCLGIPTGGSALQTKVNLIAVGLALTTLAALIVPASR